MAVMTPEVQSDIGLLQRAFESFTQASEKLEIAYGDLQRQAQGLQVELEEKNRQLEINLAEKERVKNYLDNILQSLPCGVVVLGEDGRARLANARACEMLGRPPAEVESMADLAGGPTPSERELVLHGPGGPRHLLVRSTTGPASTGLILILTDITRLRLLEEENRRGEKLRIMGSMSCQLAHEIRNPLGAIELYASMIEKSSPEGSDARRFATSMLTSARFLNNTLTNMLNFSKMLAPRFENVRIGAMASECLALVEPLLAQRGIRIDADLAEDGLAVRADPELLKQVLLNLMMNAVQAMPRGGELKLQATPATGTPDPRLLISVGDTGRGIPPENLSRIFDPFFTTNQNGTGLGLSIVHTIVEKHGGAIGVESSLGVGTTFRIALPAVRV